MPLELPAFRPSKPRKFFPRRRVTLIPAWACNGGFVIHADSGENCGDFRRTVQKIVPKDMGQLRVVVAGAGIGDLIEGFIDCLKERLDHDDAADILDVKRVME